MAKQFMRIDNVAQSLQARLLPTVTLWNRLEGRPRTENFDRTLKAEVRDALWMVGRQWQMGEFAGDDAGSPIFAKIHLATTRLTKYQPKGQAVRPFDDSVPLEGQVERRPLPLERGGKAFSLDLRLLMGRQWEKLLRVNQSETGDRVSDFRTAFPLAAPDPDAPDDAATCAHREVWQEAAAVAGRRLDGGALYLALQALAQPDAATLIAVSLPPGQTAKLNELGQRFVAWGKRLFLQPEATGDHGWQPEKLEYAFGCAAPTEAGEKVYEAEEYYHGRLDWYNFHSTESSPDWILPSAETPPDPQATETMSTVPVQLTFEGMPHPRWWTFEDRKTYFGDINPKTTDLAKLLLMEFGLVYANDWFLIPQTVQAGTISQVKGLAVTNVFGERTWVEAAGSGPDDAWQRWRMYSVSRKGLDDSAADTSLLMLPTVPKIQEGRPQEEIYLLRDEVANMVWGVETQVPLPNGSSKPGNEAAAETRSYFIRLLNQAIEGGVTPFRPEYQAAIRYEVMNSVPENWVPFVPVHISGQSRQIQLRRAAMPRLLEGDPNPPERVRPRSELLRAGLDANRPYYLHEEEVPRAGVSVSQSYQRTRWYGGRVFTWLGVRKRAGRVEGSSGLAFDRVIPVPGERRGSGDPG